jgi:uncharacterized SAM-binding protein YcdF (DUF218 family)
MIKFFFKITRWLAGGALLLGLAAWFYPEKFLTVDSGPATADVIIVIGGGSHERPLRAAELFQQHAAARVFITGAGDDGINRQLLIAHGVPARAIEIENQSTTTCENAEFTLRRLRAEHVQRAILVTSWYHARRAEKTFAHFAPELTFYSRPSYFAFAREDWKKLGINKRMRLEFLKLPGYWIRYGINPI